MLNPGQMRFVNTGVFYGPEEMDQATSFVASLHEADPAAIVPDGTATVDDGQCPFACFNDTASETNAQSMCI